MFYLSSRDLEKLVNTRTVIGIIEKAFEQYEKGVFVMPDRISLYDNENIFAYMPCFSPKAKGTKILTMYPNNINKGLPPVQGMMLLNNVENGSIKCIMDGAALTANRTGAVGAVGVKYTSKSGCTSLGVIGTGTQGFYQCLYAPVVRDLKTIYVLDTDLERAAAFKERLANCLPNIQIFVCNDAQMLLERSDIIITTTTSSQPILPDCRALLHGKHYIGIGSYKANMREYPKSLFEELDRLYIDVEYAKQESGDLVIPLQENWISEDKIVHLGQAITSGQIDTSGTTFFKSVGMALFDLCVAEHLYAQAIEKGIGQKLMD